MKSIALVLLLILLPLALPAQSTESFDPEAATSALLDQVPAEQKARSDAYFEGGYWLQLWSFLIGIAIAWILLHFRISLRIRQLATRVTKVAGVHRFIYWIGYLAVTSLLLVPWLFYTGFVREHQYGLSNQSFGAWAGEFAKGFGLEILFGGLLVTLIYSVIARYPRTWWIRAALVVITFLIIGIAIGPVFINPLFNEYTPLEDPEVREPILRIAHANGIDAENVWVMDASKQTSRISANVSGLLGTMRITLNDNLLSRTSLPEIEAVMAHEIGHYVLNHIWKMIIMLGIVIVIGGAFVFWGFERLWRRYGERWGIESAADPAGFPLLVALFSAFFFLATPVTNTIIRVQEVEADMFGLNAARQPDGFAEVALKLGEYRKLDPGPIEEALFFDHPSGRQRILMSMRWKAAQVGASHAP
ncbi:MAG: M48 family metallopeptidase [Acidobacteria bacterium]|nr:M48 family metallopeptidase [Acidobacteriota bacterium]